MKRSYLLWGIIYLMGGLCCLAAALLSETPLDGLAWGGAGAGIACGLMTIIRYFYWRSPKRAAAYEERLETERIEMADELKTQLRNRAGRAAYVAGIYVTCIAMLVFSVLDSFGVNINARTIILFLFGYLLFQYIIGIVIFHKLSKKYF